MRYILLLLTCFFSTLCYGQKDFTVSGTLKDTFNFSPTIYTSVSLIRASDSILETFTRADDKGYFQLKTNKEGAYILLIAHPGFAQYSDVIQVKGDVKLGEIPMIPKRNVLADVLIRDKQKIVIKGDTVEFNADSFKTRQYDNVDELLKKLPGIEVSSDGTIKAYGEKVQKMLVDGEEFFSDDPAIVAKTLRASAVDKVQVFDKKSDQAEFTGIDDGDKIKTINLKLKEDAKHGYFGKVGLGGGLPDHWENQAMINSFSKTRRFTAFGIMSNTSKTALGWDEISKYDPGNSSTTFEDGVMTTTSYLDNFYNRQGIPKTWTGGLHYGNKFLKDKLDVNGGYKYVASDVESINNNITQFILPDTQYINQQNSTQKNNLQKHSVNFSSEYDLDSLSSIKLTMNGSITTGIQNTTTNSNARAFNGNLINDQTNSQVQNTDNENVDASLFYKKKFKEKGRSFSINLSENWKKYKNSGHLNSRYNLYSIDSTYVVDQNKEVNGATQNLQAKMTYTEPLSEKVFLAFNYGISSNRNQSVHNSYDADSTGASELGKLNELYSSNYQYNSAENKGGINMIMNFKKINLTFGADIANTQFSQIDRTIDSTFSYANLNFFPRLSLNFKKSRMSSFSFRYNGSTEQPSISQLQPLRQNEDPLNIAIGNPDLKQEFNHSFNFNLNNYKEFSGTYTNFNLNFTLVQNAISQKQTIDLTGRSTYQYVNVNGDINGYFYLNHSFKKIKHLRPSLSLNGNYYKTNGFINGEANTNANSSIGTGLNLSYYKDTTFNIYYSISPTYNNTQSTIRTDIKTNYWQFEQSLKGSVNLPLHFELGTDINWKIRQKIDPQERNNNVFIWNAYVSKSFLKDRSLVAKFYANDILNRNSGYSRYNSPNQISESTYNTIKRYFLLSLTWNFTKTGAKKDSVETDTTE